PAKGPMAMAAMTTGQPQASAATGAAWFTVAIIPYTYKHTNIHQLKVGDTVNLEFDIVGKYVKRLLND
ncbi:MAG: hypothetical protein AAF519_18825, partial [Bacteroidota bacterium]